MIESEISSKTACHSGIQNVSSIYGNVRECILLFENGTQKVISNEQEKGTLTVNILSHLAKENNFVESVIRNYDYTDRLEDLSEKCGFNSIKTFTRHFKNNFRVTPKQWMLSIKKEVMLDYLRNTDYPLKQIVAQLGFSNLSHLSDFCLKRTGMRPDEIRKRIID
ncbi:MAG: AraC family transcriptional regulator [Proteiniphilum sp.]